MKLNARQYTIRNVPADVDRVLRRRARDLGKSFNQVALEALVAGAGLELTPQRDLSDIVGSLKAPDADRMDEEIRRQRRIDMKAWH
jgi:hypothetical protein